MECLSQKKAEQQLALGQQRLAVEGGEFQTTVSEEQPLCIVARLDKRNQGRRHRKGE
ncbi:hypothetical protein PI125_g9743 [Phytophthora idaei]|nr:hypothetical protein PI125_g9743 [Phytophthora idaei]